MKKSTLRLSAVVLACVPLLVGGASFVNAEDVQDNTASSVVNESKTTTTSSEVKDATKDKKDESTKEETSPVETKTLKVDANKISGQKGDTGKVKLAKIKLIDETSKTEKDVELKGTFEPELKNDFINVKKDGSWTALNLAENKEIQLDFKPDLKDVDTKKVLTAMFPGESLENRTFKTDKISVNFVKVEIPDKVDVKLELTAKNRKNKIVVLHEGTEMKATFKEVKNDKIELGTDGTFKIPTTNKEKSFTEKVSFTLDSNDSYFKTLAETTYKTQKIITEYKDITATITPQDAKTITLSYKTKTLTSKINAGGKLEFEDVEKVQITGKFEEIKNNEFISLDAQGNWKALKAGQGTIDPTFTISEASMKELQSKYPDQEIKIATGELKVDFSETGSNKKTLVPVDKKEYVPAKKLPQTGEEKMRFAGIIGIVVLVIVGLIFFMKKKKNNDDNTNENNN